MVMMLISLVCLVRASLASVESENPTPSEMPAFKATKGKSTSKTYELEVVGDMDMCDEEGKFFVPKDGVYAFNVDFKCENGYLCEGMKLVKMGLDEEDEDMKFEVEFRTNVDNSKSLEQNVHGNSIIFLERGDVVRLEPLKKNTRPQSMGLFATPTNDDGTITDIVFQGAMLRSLDWQEKPMESS